MLPADTTLDPDLDPATRGAPSSRLAWGLFAVWCGLLALPVLQVRAPIAGAGLTALRSASELGGLACRVLAWAALETLRLAPLGFLAVLALPARARRRDRAVLVAMPALAVTLAGALLARWLVTRSAGAWSSGLAESLLALPGSALGTAAGLAWRRGRRARLLFLPKLAAAGVAFLTVLALLAWMAIEPEARVPEPAPIASAEKVRLGETLRGKHPRKIPPGETRTLRLDATNVERLLAWAWTIQRQGRATVGLEGPGVASVAVSVRVPRTETRWLNAAASFRLGVEGGDVDLDITSLRVGRLPVPRPALALSTPVLLTALRADPRVRGVLDSIRSLRLEAGAVTCTFSRLELPHGQLSLLVWGEDAAGGVRAVVGEQIDLLLDALEGTQSGDERFAAAIRIAFAAAARRSREGSHVEENRAALMALGIVLGHERLAWLISDPLDARRAARIERLRAGTTVRGRGDWVRHFTVSGAITVLASEAPSDAAGLYKEERDAFGGSGFSFGDLLADRAGTTFAEFSTRDEASAAAMQERLARGVRIEELFPEAADLPEGIMDGELQARYGGVDGLLYRRWAGEIERRISALAAHWE